MLKIFVLTKKKSNKQEYYTTLAALCEDKLKEELGVSKFTLDRVDFSLDCYENDICKIEQVTVKKRSDILRDREQFL